MTSLGAVASNSTLLAFGMPGTTEMIIILALGLLIFGRRLPEVGRNIGRSIVEFKRGIKDVENEVERSSDQAHLPESGAEPNPYAQASERVEKAAESS